MKNKCIVCDSTYIRPFYTGMLKCGECGHCFADLRLTSEEELFQLYNREYFCGKEYCNYIVDKKVLQKNFRLRLEVLRKFLDPLRHKNLFEIGCAYGFFLEIAKDIFYNVQGIDISEDSIRYARKQLNLDVIQGNFLPYNLEDRKFDVVCLWDTIEHLHAPHLYIEKLSRHMESDALLAITTGDIESLNARVKKDKWRLIYPTHIHYFSKETIRRILDKYGFDIIYNRYCGFYRSIDNIAYSVLVLRKKGKWLYNLLQGSRLTRFDLYLNLYDIMYVIARKR